MIPESATMHVVFVVDSLMIGGTELAALRTFRLLRTSVKLSLIHFHATGPLLEEYRTDGAAMHHIALYGIRSPKNIGSILRLRRLLRQLRPDVIHSHDAYSNMVILASLWPNFAIPWVASRRWLDQYVRGLHRRLNTSAFRRASAVAVNSEAIAAHMIRSERIPTANVVVIPNFVDIPADLDASRKSSSPSRIIVGMVARLTRVKRHDIAIAAVANLIAVGLDIQLVIVGEGEEREDIQTCIAAHGIESYVTLVGEKRGGATIHVDFDVVLSTSDSEGSPNSVLEAMAAGRPVVATDVGGTRDLIRHGIEGFLVPAGDVAAITESLRRLAVAPELRRLIGEAGRIRAQKTFSPPAVSQQLVTMYERITAGTGHNTSAAKQAVATQPRSPRSP
jgi:glycosyltransferase involved in cell wall biosynthesis